MAVGSAWSWPRALAASVTLTADLLSRGSQVRVLPGALGETRRGCEIACKQSDSAPDRWWSEWRPGATFCTSVCARGRILVASKVPVRRSGDRHTAPSVRGSGYRTGDEDLDSRATERDVAVPSPPWRAGGNGIRRCASTLATLAM
jgi:hypothetical protein